eukprot:scaffold8059_cov62-Phaeocystis_antarctica.AAC.5
MVPILPGMCTCERKGSGFLRLTGQGRTRTHQCRRSRRCTWSRERAILCDPEHAQYASDWMAWHKRVRSKSGGHLVKVCPLASWAHARHDPRHCDREHGGGCNRERDQVVRRYRL